VIDYLFFQQLTGSIQEAEQARNTDRAQALTALRTTVLDLTAEIDAEIQRATEQAAGLLQEILQSDDLEQAVLDNLAQIDDLFLRNLALTLQTAEQQGRTEDVEKLQRVGDALTKLIQESSQQVTPRLLEIMRQVGDSLSQSGREPAAQRLAEIREQAKSFIE
jgi:HD superfamily phosphodiesterase